MVKKQHKAVGDVPELIEKRIHGEFVSLYPELGAESYLADCLSRCVEKTGRQFVFIIDEWDAPIREAKEDTNAQMAYLNLLREWFKNNNFPGKKLRLIRNVLRMIFKLLGAGMMG